MSSNKEHTVIDGAVEILSNGTIEVEMKMVGWTTTWELEVCQDYYLFCLKGGTSKVRAKDVIEARVEAMCLLQEQYPDIHIYDLDCLRGLISDVWLEPCVLYRKLQEMLTNVEL